MPAAITARPNVWRLDDLLVPIRAALMQPGMNAHVDLGERFERDVGLSSDAVPPLKDAHLLRRFEIAGLVFVGCLARVPVPPTVDPEREVPVMVALPSDAVTAFIEAHVFLVSSACGVLHCGVSCCRSLVHGAVRRRLPIQKASTEIALAYVDDT